MMHAILLGHALRLLLQSPVALSPQISLMPFAPLVQPWTIAAPPATSFRQVRYREISI